MIQELTSASIKLEECNIAKSRSQTDYLLNEFISDYNIPNIINREGIRKETVEEMKEEFSEFIKKFQS